MPSRASKNARQQRKDQQRHNGEGEGLGTYTPDAPSLSASPAVRPYEIDDIDILDGGALLQEEEPRGEDVVPARLNAQQDEGRVANWGTALFDVEAPVTTPVSHASCWAARASAAAVKAVGAAVCPVMTASCCERSSATTSSRSGLAATVCAAESAVGT